MKIIRISTHTNLLKLDGIRTRYPYPVSVSAIRICYPYPLSVSGIRIRYPYPVSRIRIRYPVSATRVFYHAIIVIVLCLRIDKVVWSTVDQLIKLFNVKLGYITFKNYKNMYKTDGTQCLSGSIYIKVEF